MLLLPFVDFSVLFIRQNLVIHLLLNSKFLSKLPDDQLKLGHPIKVIPCLVAYGMSNAVATETTKKLLVFHPCVLPSVLKLHIMCMSILYNEQDSLLYQWNISLLFSIILINSSNLQETVNAKGLSSLTSYVEGYKKLTSDSSGETRLNKL